MPPTAQPQTEEEPAASALGPILVIIPTYNESENIARILSRTRSAVPDAHVLIADDNSPDGTGKLADEIASNDDHVHVMHRLGKEGLGAAYLAGFEWGLNAGYEVLVEMDADGSHQPEQLPLLLAALGDADLVLGSRWVKGGEVVNWPKSREVLSRGGNLWTRIALGIPLRDATGGYRAFRRKTLLGLGLDNVASAGYCFQVDLAWRALKAGFRVVEVPITFIEREYGDSKMSQRIVAEALVRTTLWGVAHRAKQLRALATNRKRSSQRSGGFMRLRHGWPLVLLIVLLVAVPIFEVWLLIKVGQQLGLLPTVLILIARGDHRRPADASRGISCVEGAQ